MKHLLAVIALSIPLVANATVVKIIGNERIAMILKSQVEACNALLVSKIRAENNADIDAQLITINGTMRVIDGHTEMVVINKIDFTIDKKPFKAECISTITEVTVADFYMPGRHWYYADGGWVWVSK